MDLTRFMVGAAPSGPFGTSSGSSLRSNTYNDSKNKREAMYKARGGKAKKAATGRAREEKRRGLRQQHLVDRRNIAEEEDEDDGENVDSGNVVVAEEAAGSSPAKKPKLSKGVLERKKRLEEFRQQKAQKKEAEAKAKRKPFVVGKVRHHVGGNDLALVSSVKFDFGAAKTPRGGAKTPGRVFTFTGNKVTTVMKSKVASAVKFGTGVRITRAKAARIAASEAAAITATPGVIKTKTTRPKGPNDPAKESTRTPLASTTNPNKSHVKAGHQQQPLPKASRPQSTKKATPSAVASKVQNVKPSTGNSSRSKPVKVKICTPAKGTSDLTEDETNALPPSTPSISSSQGWGKTPSPTAVKDPKSQQQLGWGKTPSPPVSKDESPAAGPSRRATKGTPFPAKKKPEEVDEVDEEEGRDQLMPMTPISASAKLRSARRTPKSRLSEVAKLCDRFRTEICFERGSYSDRRKSTRKSTGALNTTFPPSGSGEDSSAAEAAGCEEVVKSLDEEVDALVGSIDSMDDACSPAPRHAAASDSSTMALAPKRLDYAEDDEGAVVIPPSREKPAIAIDPATEGKVSEKDATVAKYRRLLQEYTGKLTALCSEWEPKLSEKDDESSAAGQIRATVGKARILMDRKGRFQQFDTLIDACHFNTGEKQTKHTDLEGFWDMIFYQVEDIEKEFHNLSEMERTGSWEEGVKPAAPAASKKVTAKKGGLKRGPAVKAAGAHRAGPSSKLREMIAARRQQKAAAVVTTESPAISKLNPEAASEQVFDGGFFQVASPARKSAASALTPKRRQSLLTPGRPSLLTPGRASPAAAVKTPTGKRISGEKPSTPLLMLSVAKQARRSMKAATSPTFSSLASSSHLGTFETAMSPFHTVSTKKKERKSRRVSAALDLSADLMTFTPEQNLDTPRVRRSARHSGVMKNYKV